METSINFVWCEEKGFTHKNTWIAGKDLRKNITWIRKNKDFYSKINMEDITDADYPIFYHYLISLSWLVRSKWYIITFTCIWNFLQQVDWNIWAWCTSFFITTRIRLAMILEIKLEFFTDIDMLLTVEKVLQEENVMKYIDMQKPTINTWKGITQTVNYRIPCMGMQTIYTNWQCLKKYLLIVVDNGKEICLNSMKTLQKMIKS